MCCAARCCSTGSGEIRVGRSRDEVGTEVITFERDRRSLFRV